MAHSFHHDNYMKYKIPQGRHHTGKTIKPYNLVGKLVGIAQLVTL